MAEDLTFKQRIIVAYGHFVDGIEQQKLATQHNVNIGRVNEACLAIELAATNPKKVRAYGRPRPTRQRRR